MTNGTCAFRPTRNVSKVWGGDSAEPESLSFGPSCCANSRPLCVGRWEAESRQTRPHTFLMGPNYSNSCAEEFRPDLLWKQAALRTLHHPCNSGCSLLPLGLDLLLGTGVQEEPARHGQPPHPTPLWISMHIPWAPVCISSSGHHVGGAAEGILEDFRDGQTQGEAACPGGCLEGFPA